MSSCSSGKLLKETGIMKVLDAICVAVQLSVINGHTYAHTHTEHTVRSDHKPGAVGSHTPHANVDMGECCIVRADILLMVTVTASLMGVYCV